jgi:uncharacterized membrane protein
VPATTNAPAHRSPGLETLPWDPECTGADGNQKKREPEVEMETIDAVDDDRPMAFTINRIGLAKPFEWLARGWADLRATAWYSLRYGAAVVLISVGLTWTLYALDMGFLVPFLAVGFFLVAPVIGLGLYQMSAHLERGEPLSRCSIIEAWQRNQGQLGMVGAGLAIILQLWIASNYVLFALLYQGLAPPLDNFFARVFLSDDGRNFAIASAVVALMLLWVAYAITAVSVPLLMDNKVDGWTAIRTSVKVVSQNWPAMILWASIILICIGIGIATFYVGLAVALPLIGHGTWHAYRDSVRPQPAA